MYTVKASTVLGLEDVARATSLFCVELARRTRFCCRFRGQLFLCAACRQGWLPGVVSVPHTIAYTLPRVRAKIPILHGAALDPSFLSHAYILHGTYMP